VSKWSVIHTEDRADGRPGDPEVTSLLAGLVAEALSGTRSQRAAFDFLEPALSR
jgi:hypothetical protein